jgi:heme-degrading monooxygenase HmoA
VIVQFVKFKSGLSDEDAKRVLRERAPQFRAIPGLVQKYYGVEKETGEYTGIYLWDSEESLKEFQKSELARTIPTAYKAATTPRIELFDILFPLRG